MAISSIWTLKSASASDEKTLAAWGVSSASLSFTSQAADVLTLEFPTGNAATFTDLWAWEDEVILYRAGSVFYRGRAAMTPKTRSSSYESVVYEFRSVWWDLERVHYLEEWDTAEGTNQVSSRVQLGWDPDAEGLISTGLMLSEVVAFASAEGVSVTLDASGLSTMLVPPIEAHNQTAAQLIRAVMQWHPDAVMRVQYTASGAVLRPVSRVNASAVELAADDLPMGEFNIRERPDLQPDSVHVYYEAQVTTNDFDAEEEEANAALNLLLATDIFPASSTRTRRSLVVTLPGGSVVSETIQPAEPQYTYQPIQTRALPAAGAYDEEAELWWLEHSGLAAFGVTVDDIKLPVLTTADVQAHSLTIVQSALPQPPSAVNPNSTPVYRPPAVTDLPRELVSGTIADWMSVYAYPVIADVTIAVKKSTVDALSAVKKKTILDLGSDVATISSVESYLLRAQTEVIGTNATTKVYEKLVAISATGLETQELVDEANAQAIAEAKAKAVIPDLAENMYDSRKVLEHEGSLKLIANDAGPSRYVGNVLNVYHASKSSWGDMTALIQSEKLNLNKGETTLNFGPPEHLAAQDWAELHRAAERTQIRRTDAAMGPRNRNGASYV